MEENKKISIVIPLYNGENYIGQTIKSILASVYQNLEVLIINDGSTDSSLRICEELQKRDARIIIYSKENAGVVSARNYGADKATGGFLCFCDQDDFVDRECYSRQIERMEKDRSEICMCSAGRSVNGKTSVYELSEDACYEGDEILEHLLYPLLFNGFAVPLDIDSKNRYPQIWSCMFRMDFWRKYQFRFRAYINFEDDLLLKTEAFSKAAKISTISHVGYYWRVNLQSETYVHKYIEDMGSKQQKCYEDLCQSVSSRVKEQSVLNLLKQVLYCKQYLDAIHNLLKLPKTEAPGRGKGAARKAAVRAYFNEAIYQRDFDNCICARKYVKKGRIKPQVILTILARKWTLLSYFAEAALDYILLLTLHSQTLTKIERRLKGIR